MQELEKILKEIKEVLEENKVIELNVDCTVDRCIIDVALAWDSIKAIIHNHINDGWIPMEERLPIPNKEIWVTAKRNGNVFTSTDTMTEKGYFWNYEKENILAWKEKELIPEPYRPERRI